MDIKEYLKEHKVVLAPMAGITDRPFRQLCKEQGAGLTYTEMISTKGLFYKNKNSLPLLSVAANEGPVAVQLFGNEPVLMAEEAAKLEDGPFDIFDVNMGCPVPKVVKNGEGSALMKDPDLVEKIISEMVKRLKKPVSIKIRKGFNDECVNAVEIAKIAEGAGASMIAVHGRTREEYYRGKADVDIIKEVKDAVKIPVIGSGDIYSAQDVKNMLENTGVDAVMVARGARGNPWIFRDADCLLKTGIVMEKPSLDEVRDMMTRHLELLVDYISEFFDKSGKKSGESAEKTAVHQMRAHAGWYSQGREDSASFRREINKAESVADFLGILTRWGA